MAALSDIGITTGASSGTINQNSVNGDLTVDTAALTSAVIVAAATMAGVLVINFFPGWVRAGLPLAAGVAIYVTATDLVPEVNREPGIRMALVFFGGVAAFLVTKFIADGFLR